MSNTKSFNLNNSYAKELYEISEKCIPTGFKKAEFLLKNYDLEKAIEIGSAAAAIVVTRVGCAPAMPDLDEVLEFMNTNKINKGDKNAHTTV